MAQADMLGMAARRTLSEVVGKYGHLTADRLKSAVYLTAPMRAFLIAYGIKHALDLISLYRRDATGCGGSARKVSILSPGCLSTAAARFAARAADWLGAPDERFRCIAAMRSLESLDQTHKRAILTAIV